MPENRLQVRNHQQSFVPAVLFFFCFFFYKSFMLIRDPLFRGTSVKVVGLSLPCRCHYPLESLDEGQPVELSKINIRTELAESDS